MFSKQPKFSKQAIESVIVKAKIQAKETNRSVHIIALGKNEYSLSDERYGHTVHTIRPMDK